MSDVTIKHWQLYCRESDPHTSALGPWFRVDAALGTQCYGQSVIDWEEEEGARRYVRSYGCDTCQARDFDSPLPTPHEKK